jgi:hypothetical protein
MLVQGCCRAPERAERSYHNRTPAWALFFKPGSCIVSLPISLVFYSFFFFASFLAPAGAGHTSII